MYVTQSHTLRYIYRYGYSFTDIFSYYYIPDVWEDLGKHIRPCYFPAARFCVLYTRLSIFVCWMSLYIRGYKFHI